MQLIGLLLDKHFAAGSGGDTRQSFILWVVNVIT